MVSALAGRGYGIGPVALSLPCIVGRGGIARQLMLSMSEEEQRMLQHSAAVLDKAYQSLGAGGARAGTTHYRRARGRPTWPEPGTPRQPAANWARHPPAHGALPGHTGPARRTAGAPTLH